MKITVGQFKKLVAETMEENPSYRYGQAVFNTMYSLYPDLANRCRGTMADPFYDDSKAERFICLCLLELEDTNG